MLEEELLTAAGVRAVSGGSHLGWGTHNALLGLQSGSYLELIAPETGRDGPWARRFTRLQQPALQAWCVRGGTADELADRIEQAGLEARRVPGQRLLPDGGELRWELLFPLGHDFGGLVPFFIDWRASGHPTTRLPEQLGLVQLRLNHPEAGALRQLLAGLGVPPELVQVGDGPRAALAAVLATPKGTLTIDGLIRPSDYLGDA